MAEETQALIRFVEGWAEDGISEDGMPRFRPTVRIIKSIPPFTQVDYEATEQDFADFPYQHQAFLKEHEAREMQPGEAGFPLALWPVISPAIFKMLSARDIVTVEQLAKLAGRTDAPGEIREVADRAKAMLAMSANLGKFETIIRELKGEKEVLTEQVKELGAALSAANAMINTLKMKVA